MADTSQLRFYARWGSPLCLIRAFPSARAIARPTPPFLTVALCDQPSDRPYRAVLVWRGFPYFTSIGEFMALVLAICVGVVEVPFLCVCVSQCQMLSIKLQPLEDNLLMRGGFYMALALLALVLPMLSDSMWLGSHWSLTITFLLQAHKHSPPNLNINLFPVVSDWEKTNNSLLADGVLYVAGHMRNEGGAAEIQLETTAKPVDPQPTAAP